MLKTDAALSITTLDQHHQNSGMDRRQDQRKSTTTVDEFYSGRSILITGATGFMGKVLIEKLLRSCPEIDAIYVLIRPSAKGSTAERLQILLNNEVFAVIRELNAGALQKLIAIPGDMLDENLGISKENVGLMANKVSIVFHTAATVKFDEALRLSLELNVVGTQRIVALCRHFQKLEALVHVSTAYANCDRPVIAEQIYMPPAEPEMILQLLTGDKCMNFSSTTLESLTSRIVRGHAHDEGNQNTKIHVPLGSRPNTYTYTKALAEYVLHTSARDLPVVIARPSIVGAAWKEPMPGWIDNYNGPSGLLLAIGSGALRHMRGDVNAIADIIPVDLACNMLILIAYDTVQRRQKEVAVAGASNSNAADEQHIRVYHCSTGASGNATTWGELEKYASATWIENPTERLYRVPALHFWRKWYMQQLMGFVDHWIPAYLFDCYQRLTGQEPKMVQLYKKLDKATRVLEYFTQNQWVFMQTNTLRLLDSLSNQDLQDFDIDIRKICWREYVKNYCLGIKRFVLKEDLAKLPEARIKLQKRMGLVKQLAWGIVSMLVTAALTKLGLLRHLGIKSHTNMNKIAGGIMNGSSQRQHRVSGNSSSARNDAGGGGAASSSTSSSSSVGGGASSASHTNIVAYVTFRKVLLVVIRFCIHLIKILLSSNSSTP